MLCLLNLFRSGIYQTSNSSLYKTHVITHTVGTIRNIFFLFWEVREHGLTTARCRNLES